MEPKFLETILFASEKSRKCYVIHAKEKAVAIESSKKAGFRYVKDILEKVDRRVSDLLNQK